MYAGVHVRAGDYASPVDDELKTSCIWTTLGSNCSVVLGFLHIKTFNLILSPQVVGDDKWRSSGKNS